MITVCNTTCLDVDECSAGLHDCSDICSNTEGGFVCQCAAGFIGDGFNCTGKLFATNPQMVLDYFTFYADVDECHTLEKPCGLDPLATCANTEGAFDCVCPESYEWNGVYCKCM